MSPKKMSNFPGKTAAAKWNVSARQVESEEEGRSIRLHLQHQSDVTITYMSDMMIDKIYNIVNNNSAYK